MHKIKRTYIILLILILSFITQTAVCHGSTPSDWAKSDVNDIASMSLIPQNMIGRPYNEPITRVEFCYLVANMYKKVSGKEIPLGVTAFPDTYDAVVCGAAELGIINGYSDGNFYPDNPINRQELATMICRALSLCGINTWTLSNEAIYKISCFEDKNMLAAWASDSFTFCMSNNIMKGVSDTRLEPLTTTTREQAIVVINRCLKNLFDITSQPQNPYDLLSCDVSGDVNFVSFSNRALTINWQPIENAASYRIGLYLSANNFWYSDSNTFVKLYTATSSAVTLKNLRAGKEYKIIVDAVDAAGNVIKCLYATAYPHELYTLQEKEKIIFADGDITSKEIADSQMQSVTVKIWAINSSGNKYTSAMTLSVHKNIAKLVEMVFDEIYNGEEKFPFKDGGAYSWRAPMSGGSYSHHNYGTAIDLNYNENYCLYKNGTFVGKHWKPYEDIYSFPPDGEVISIFAKYGFAWGGDEWSNPKDYMHFSYLEL